ncbi:hypothetical protein KCP69_07300 [Salmonella enterica subsp. enterica]|nr:hypothetical protein KCP69_07300 [Salmonella enterica subsp. enterica]
MPVHLPRRSRCRASLQPDAPAPNNIRSSSFRRNAMPSAAAATPLYKLLPWGISGRLNGVRCAASSSTQYARHHEFQRLSCPVAPT